MPCREHLSQLRHQQAELDRLGVRVAVVTFEADFMARRYVADEGLSWPLLVDEQRALYKHYGMLSASWWDIWGPRTWWAYLRGLSHGVKLKRAGADIRQRGGDVLIDPEGRVRLCHVGDGPADRPAVETLLSAVRG